MDLSDFDYDLPSERIAQAACIPRDSAKLLVLREGIVDTTFRSIVSELQKGDVLVMNQTKVLHAKIIGKKSTGSPAEVILTKKIDKYTFECRIKTKRPTIGTILIFNRGTGRVSNQLSVDEFVITFDSLAPLKDAMLPQPPYITRRVKDAEYQTTFAKIPGSLAAPTAGLHFTKRILDALAAKGVQLVYITLHVSYGTFKNIDTTIASHRMDPEWFEITPKAAKSINQRKGRLFVVGTTTLKALESSSKQGKIIPAKGESTLFIHPPFTFQSGADGLITNFHLPKSTLLLLTCAFGGKKRVMNAYAHAVKETYRFYSLGDAMLIYRVAHKE